MISLLSPAYNKPSSVNKKQAIVLFSGDEIEYESIKPAPQSDQVRIGIKRTRDEAIKAIRARIPGSEGKSLSQVRKLLNAQEAKLEKREGKAKTALYWNETTAAKALDLLKRERQTLEDAKAAFKEWSLIIETSRLTKRAGPSMAGNAP